MVKENKSAQKRRRQQAQRSTPGKPEYALSRYLLTGAALGLYFGLFFRPARAPSLLVAVGLSLISALAVTLLQLRKPEQRNGAALLRYFVKAWAGFALVLAMLEARHFFYDLGGRLATSLFTVVYGAGMGWLYAKTSGQEAK